MTIPCAICHRPADPSPSNPWRPFCSERCKLVDLSHWLDGDYRIPGPSAEGEPDDGVPDGDSAPEEPTPDER